MSASSSKATARKTGPAPTRRENAPLAKKRSLAILAAGIALVTFCVYLKALHNGFLEWDDGTYVVENTHLRTLDPVFLKWAFFGSYAANWHPLTWISHALDYAFWGLDPRGHHLTNIILHAANTLLVTFLAARLVETAAEKGEQDEETLAAGKGRLVAAAVTGLLFGLHPLHVESVAWVAERKDLLCAFFFLASILAYLNYGRGAAAGPGQGQAAFLRARPYLASLCFFFLALLSKPMAVSLPLVLLILDWYPLHRRAPRAVVVEKLPFLALSAASSVITLFAQQAGGAVAPIAALPLASRLGMAFVALVSYLARMIAPVGLLPFYPYPRGISILSPAVLGAAALVAAITAGSVRAAKRHPVWLAAWGCYLVTLLPVIGIVQVGRQAMADRYTYLPSIGAFILIGLAAAFGARKAAGRPVVGAAITGAAVVLLALLAYGTSRQIEVWHDGITLWTPVIDRYRGREHEGVGLALAYSNRGIALHRSQRLDAAIADYTKAIELEPKDDAYYKNRGTAWLEKKEFEPALADFMRAIELNPSSGGSYYNVACLHALRNETAEACAWLKKSIDHGYDDRERIASDPDLAAIRGASCYGAAVTGK